LSLQYIDEDSRRQGQFKNKRVPPFDPKGRKRKPYLRNGFNECKNWNPIIGLL